MDRVDVGIIRWFFQGQLTVPSRPGVQPMIRSLSKQLGVTGETVRNRMRRMFESGVLNGIVLEPNPSLLGMEIGALGFFAPQSASRPKLAKKLALVDGMQVVATHLDGLIGLIFLHYGGESLEMKVKLMKEIAGVSDGFFTEIQFPSCQLELSRTDWRIMAALRPDATKTHSELSKELGLSSRTIKRRLDRMVSGGAVFTRALHQVRAVEGAIEVNILVFYDDHAKRSETDSKILKELDDYLLYAGIWARYSPYYVSVPNLSTAEGLAARVGKIRGVKEARASIMEERLELYESIDPVLARKLSEVGWKPLPAPIAGRTVA